MYSQEQGSCHAVLPELKARVPQVLGELKEIKLCLVHVHMYMLVHALLFSNFDMIVNIVHFIYSFDII
jgi:hypothetical protein